MYATNAPSADGAIQWWFATHITMGGGLGKSVQWPMLHRLFRPDMRIGCWLSIINA